MTGLARLTDQVGTVYINPDHVRTVSQKADGTQLLFADGKTLAVKEKLNVVVAAIQGAVR